MVELTLAQFAELSLRLERGELRSDVLRDSGLSETEWLEQQMAWLERMSAQLERQRKELFDRYLLVRAEAAQELGDAGPRFGPGSDKAASPIAGAPAGGTPSAQPNTGFIAVEPPALYAPPAGGVPRAAPTEALRSMPPPVHLSEAYGVAPVPHSPASMSALPPVLPLPPAPAFVHQVPSSGPPAYVQPTAPPATSTYPPATPPPVVMPPEPVVVPPPVFVQPVPVVAPPPVFVQPVPVVAPPPVFVRPAPVVAPPPAAPTSAPIATAYFMSSGGQVAQPVAPLASIAPQPAQPTHAGKPRLTLTQLALLVAELTAFPDRSATTLAESGLTAQTWQDEWAAWQVQFSLQPEEHARYQPLVDYYTALRKPRESKS